jgi:hypothetical protein
MYKILVNGQCLTFQGRLSEAQFKAKVLQSRSSAIVTLWHEGRKINF